MLEWKPPDPRIVDLVRRIQDAARRRFRHAPGSPESLRVIDEKTAPVAGQDDSRIRDGDHGGGAKERDA